jgi:hypothetical protein
MYGVLGSYSTLPFTQPKSLPGIRPSPLVSCCYWITNLYMEEPWWIEMDLRCGRNCHTKSSTLHYWDETTLNQSFLISFTLQTSWRDATFGDEVFIIPDSWHDARKMKRSMRRAQRLGVAPGRETPRGYSQQEWAWNDFIPTTRMAFVSFKFPFYFMLKNLGRENALPSSRWPRVEWTIRRVTGLFIGYAPPSSCQCQGDLHSRQCTTASNSLSRSS